jgi:SAM-dependent methyltransferase
MPTKSWYRSWFDSPYYHILYRDRDEVEAAKFIDRVLKYFDPPPYATFLDLACGKGRHSKYVSEKNFNVTGIDLSPRSISTAKQYENERLNFAVHDMREPYKHAAFDYVLNLFTSFGYFSKPGQNEQVLKSAYYNLKAKGKILIDFLNAHRVIGGLVEEELKEIEGITFKITRDLDDGIIQKNIKIIDGDNHVTFHERVKALTRQDFSGMLHRAGFEIIDIFGDYNLAMFDENTSPRLIIVARTLI